MNLSVSGEAEITAMMIHDHLGREVFRVDGYLSKVDVSVFSQGLYTIKLSTNSGYLVKKFLVY